MWKSALLVCSALTVVCQGETHWALLVAGSAGYDNYRHQADICHAYHVLHNHGIPDENIVVMMMDDIANSEQNPFQGNIINEPDGPNVYPGVLKDYTGKEVTPEVFLKVLTGDSAGVEALIGRKGKVINSGPDDRVFVNFADHGAPGLIAFPDEFLYANSLNNATKWMYDNKRYKQLVFYIEACESGSMFQNLLSPNINVFATTAANAEESSYACYYDAKRDTYLGDVYSVMWMQNSDKANLAVETLQQQFKVVKEETNTSHVQEFGNIKIGRLPVADFQGNLSTDTLFFVPRKPYTYNPNDDAVKSEDVKLEILKRKMQKNDADAAVYLKYRNLLQTRKGTSEFFSELRRSLSSEMNGFIHRSATPMDWKCYKQSIDMIRTICPGINLPQNDYALRNLHHVVDICNSGISYTRIYAAIGKTSYNNQICSERI